MGPRRRLPIHQRHDVQTDRYYADYFSFTLSEAADVRLRLSSSQAKRLYLLKGAGTGGDVVTSASSSSGNTVASITRALPAGTYTIETTTYNAEREADFWLSIDSMAAAPASWCVTSLGTLTAGSVTTQSGEWNRDDGCRSTNATTSQTARYYADYFSFTLSEAADVRLRLSSSQAKRLYLLKGAGTGGDVVTSASSSSGNTVASITRVLSAGTYTIETTTYNAEREADFSLLIDSMATAPPAACVTSLGTLTAGSVTAEAGSWDRDDGCRSTNATTSQTDRYYATISPSRSRRRLMCVCGCPAARPSACISSRAPAPAATWSPRRPPAAATRSLRLLVRCRQAPTRSRPPPTTRSAKRTSG